MARRKRELLDLLRERRPGSGSASGSEEGARPARPSAPSRPSKASPAARRPSRLRESESATGAGLWAWLKTPLLVVAVLGLVVLGLSLPNLLGGSKEIEASPTGDQAPYAVLAAQYAASRENIAIATARAIRDQLGDGIEVQLIRFPGPEQEMLELWIGGAAEASTLEPLLQRIRAARVPTDRNNPQPFATARIDRRRQVESD